MSTYRIRSGDTLSALARRFDTTVSKLASLNHLSNPNLIITGHTLRIPDGVDSPAKQTSAPRKPASPPRAPSAPPRPPANGKPGKVGLDKVPRGETQQYAYFQQLVKQ